MTDFIKHNIQLPATNLNSLSSDEAYFFYQNGNGKEKILFHDYGKLYDVPGLYEQLFYQRLKCASHQKVTSLLKKVIDENKEVFSELRVLDIGAGNGIAGEELVKQGISRLVGVDIIDEAKSALLRDRPGIYDEYYIMDLTKLTDKNKAELSSWHFNCMVCVAALGFNDIPIEAFINAFNLIEDNGWVAFNIKETFFDKTDESGFSRLIKDMIFEQAIDIHHIERYRHRLSIEGKPLHYFTIIGRKQSRWLLL